MMSGIARTTQRARRSARDAAREIERAAVAR
jgi:hypothetical protein